MKTLNEYLCAIKIINHLTNSYIEHWYIGNDKTGYIDLIPYFKFTGEL